MTNLEKWKKKFAEAKDGSDFVYILEQMKVEHYKKFCSHKNCDKFFGDCKDCRKYWLDMEVEDD